MKEFPVNRPVSVLMLTLLMVLLGAAAYQRLPQDLFPDVSQPELIVETIYDGAASSEVEQNVTRKIEAKLGTVSGVTSMSSTSGDEKSRIALTFQWGTDMNTAAMDVRAKIDEVRSDLPEETKEPLVLRQSSNSSAVLVLNIATNPAVEKPIPVDELRKITIQTLKPRLERLNGVASVDVRGGKEYEVQVRAVPDKLRATGLSILELRDALERENLSQRGGKLKEGDTQFLIRTVGSVSIENLAQLIVSRPGENPIRRLGEVAIVTPHEVEKSPESLARLKTAVHDESIPSVEVSIYKVSGGNSVEIAEATRQVRLEFLADLAQQSGNEEPPLQISIAYDESVFINESLEMVRSNGVVGLMLAGIILLFFLGQFQSTVIVVLAMPVSVIATFSLFYAGNISVNIFSMAGLTLAVGMVVDNAIVVTEAIFHKLKHERRIKKAITEAISEIGPAVWASTLTTIAVFLPVVFVPGIAGQIFRDLSWVITYTLIFSMIVAFTLIPMLTCQVMSTQLSVFDWINRSISILLWPFQKLGSKFADGYRWILGVVIESRSTRLLLIVVMVLAFVLSLANFPSTEFFPDTKVESYQLTLRPRAGQTLAAVDRGTERLEQELNAITTLNQYGLSISPGAVSTIASFDKGAVNRGEIKPLQELQPLIDSLKREAVFQDTFLDYQLESLNPIHSLLGTNQGDIVLKVSGPDMSQIRQILQGAEGDGGILGELNRNRNKYGIVSVGKIPQGLPESILKIKRDAAADRGLTLNDIADQVEAAVAGTQVTDLEIRNTNYDIVLSSAEKVSSQVELLDLDIVSPQTRQNWKLGDVATIESQTGPLQILREERERMIAIPIFVAEDVALGDVVARIERPVQEAIATFQPGGYRASLGGASESMNQSLKYLLYAFMVAIFLVYMIMASQFESLIHPLTIMFSVPLSMIGALVGLRLCGELISLTAMIGVIMLAGIVVNNAIILIDYINILRARGQPRNQAIINAGSTRLRPILMTTLTTVLGMLPLALGYGTGAELYRPLAVVIVFGLSFSTLLTLVFIPAIYCVLDDIADFLGLASFRISNLFGKSH